MYKSRSGSIRSEQRYSCRHAACDLPGMPCSAWSTLFRPAQVIQAIQAPRGLGTVETKPILNFALPSCMLFNNDSGLGGGG